MIDIVIHPIPGPCRWCRSTLRAMFTAVWPGSHHRSMVAHTEPCPEITRAKFDPVPPPEPLTPAELHPCCPHDCTREHTARARALS